jgi:hypothetical protein
VAEAEDRGDLVLQGWYYRFETGEILGLDGAARQFVCMHDRMEDELPVA